MDGDSGGKNKIYKIYINSYAIIKCICFHDTMFMYIS